MKKTYKKGIGGILLSSWLVICALFTGCDFFTIPSPAFYNLDMEAEIGETAMPYSWGYSNKDGYTIRLMDNPEGKGKCLRIFCEKPNRRFEKNDSLANNIFYIKLPEDLVQGKKLEIKAKVRTKAVTQHAGLFIYTMEGDSLLQEAYDPQSRMRATRKWDKISLETNVDQRATNIFIGGIMRGRGTAWFDDFEIRIDGKRLKDADRPSPPTPAEVEWLRKYILPIRSVDPDEPADDLAPLIEKLKDAQVVALGGSAFGSSENYRMRHRIIRALAEQEGFNMLALNALVSAAPQLNAYTIDRKGDLFLWGLGQGNWERKDFQDLINWIREFNKEHPPIYISGYENYNYRNHLVLLEFCIKHFLGESDPSLSLVDEVKTYINLKYNPEHKEETGLKEKEKQIIISLREVSTRILNKLDEPRERDYFLRRCYLLEQSIGNQFMHHKSRAENILWDMRNRPDSRVILWGGNEVKKSGRNSLAECLSREGVDYLSVGFAFYGGKYSSDVQTTAIDAYPGTYEYYFHQLDEPCFMIDLRDIRQDTSPEGRKFNQTALFREMNGMNITTEFIHTQLTADYDILIFIDQSTGLKHLRY